LKKSKLAQFMLDSSSDIISEWEKFAQTYVPAAGAMDLKARRDHIQGMLEMIAKDLSQPQTKGQQASKSTGKDDADVESDTAANSHGTDRAATGFSPVDLVSEFRALRASVLRLWSEAQHDFTRENLDEVTRFNEAIDQLLAESMAKYDLDVIRSKDMFLGVLGHDLRNPLGAIMMSATVMMTHEGPDWRHSKTASRILTAGARMDALISDLVDFTRTRLGSGIPIVRAAMDMETVCKHAVDEITAFHPRSKVQFTATGDLHGEWDAGRIGQLLSNLAGNAFQHGSPDAPIEVGVRGQAESVELTVYNKGKRIPRDHLKDIFDPFKQLHASEANTKATHSVGLGLYIVQAIVMAHAGTIDVASTEDGTTFTVHLPRTPS
jgi:signal transduction histidine kinase